MSRVENLHFLRIKVSQGSSGGMEAAKGVNNKIKVMKRKAYGFHDLQYFTLKIYQAFYN